MEPQKSPPIDVYCYGGLRHIEGFDSIAPGVFAVPRSQTDELERELGPIREFRLTNGQRLLGFRSASGERTLMIEE